jgi:hypothetical protein
MASEPLPPILYKFLAPRIGAEGPISFLGASHMLRFTQSGSFNDPFECRPTWALSNAGPSFAEMFALGETDPHRLLTYPERKRVQAKDRAWSRHLLKNNPVGLQASMTDAARRIVDGVCGALCLAGSWNIAPMWAHYCSNARGLAVGLHTAHPFFRKSVTNFPFKVEYLDEPAVLHAEAILRPDDLGVRYFATKDRRWSYEDEYRVVRALNQATKKAGRDEVGNPIYLFKVPTEIIAEVIVGLHASAEYEAEVAELCKDLPSVRLFRLRLGLGSYNFEREEIPLN